MNDTKEEKPAKETPDGESAKQAEARRRFTEYLPGKISWVNDFGFAAYADGVLVFEFHSFVPRVGAAYQIEAERTLIAMHPDLARKLANELLNFVGTPEDPK